MCVLIQKYRFTEKYVHIRQNAWTLHSVSQNFDLAAGNDGFLAQFWYFWQCEKVLEKKNLFLVDRNQH